IPRGFLAHTGMSGASDLFGGDNRRMSSIEEARNGRDMSRCWRSALYIGYRTVIEDAAQRANPATRRSEREPVRASGIRRCHAADRAEVAARRINRETQPLRERSSIN